MKYCGGAVFLLSFLWFYFPGEYVLMANQDQGLFFLTLDHFLSYAQYPGGVLEYLGHFLTQFYRFPLAGAMILAGVITATYLTVENWTGKLAGNRGCSLLAFIVPLLLIGMHNHYPHQLHQSLGFLLVMVHLILVPRGRSARRVYFAAAIPVFYFFAGGFVLLFCILMLTSELILMGNQHAFTKGTGSLMPGIEVIIWNLLYPVLIILLGARLIFLDPLTDLFIDPLPVRDTYPVPYLPWIFIAWLILLTVLGTGRPAWLIPLRGLKRKALWSRVFPGVVILGLVAFLMVKYTFNPKNRDFFTIERMAVEEDWDGLLRYADRHPSTNLFGTFYTNLALANQGLLCTSLFNYPQVFGPEGLCFGWDAKAEILKRGSDFFWTIHFVNEAHHWSFESMVVEGFTARNLKRLIQTELVRGNYKVAEKYIGLLDRTLFDRAMANHYRSFLNRPDRIREDPELGSAMRMQMDQDFFSEGADLGKNLRSLVANDPSNGQAYDYLMALLLMEKKVDEIVELLPGYLNQAGGNLPRLLEESLVVYNLLHRGEGIQDIPLSRNTMQRFTEYSSVLRRARNQQEAARILYPLYGNTFWFHMNFSNI
jgi:hypothetical protein